MGVGSTYTGTAEARPSHRSHYGGRPAMGTGGRGAESLRDRQTLQFRHKLLKRFRRSWRTGDSSSRTGRPSVRGANPRH
jgi:hypothetical protein